MDVIQAIKTRRSVRKFQTRDVPEWLISEILSCGDAAPSTKNLKPWLFRVIKNPLKKRIIRFAQEDLRDNKNPYYNVEPIKKSMLKTFEFTDKAPILILVFNRAPHTGGEHALLRKIDQNRIFDYSVEIQSIAAAIQNMLLAAHGLDLGAVWVADFCFIREQISRILDIKYDLVAGVVLGYEKHL